MKNIKCVVIGDDCCNKTSLIISYTTNCFPGEHIPDVFDNYSANFNIEDTSINLQIWDTQGQEDYKKLRPLAYPGTDIFVILFSLVRPLTLENVERVWVPEIKEHCPDIPYILVGVDSKLRDDFPQHFDEFKANGWELIKTEKGLEMKKKIGAFDYIECDVVAKFHLREVFETAANVVLNPQKSSEDGLKKKDGKFHLFKKQKDKK